MRPMARFVTGRDLNARIAATVGRRAVERLKDQVRDGARRRAPEAAVWVTMFDERVRYSHAETHDQTIPGNLRFKLPEMIYIRKGRGADGKALNPAGGWTPTGGVDLARKPRDPALPAHQRENCRCLRTAIPQGVARTIHAGPTVVTGPRARAEVYTRFPRAAESEFGTSEDVPARFMSGGTADARAHLRARAARR